MDEAFNANDRIWISKSNFNGSTGFEFLRSWTKVTEPSSDEEEEEEPVVNLEDKKRKVVSPPSECNSPAYTVRSLRSNKSLDSFVTALSRQPTPILSDNSTECESPGKEVPKKLKKLGDYFFALLNEKAIEKENRKRKRKRKRDTDESNSSEDDEVQANDKDDGGKSDNEDDENIRQLLEDDSEEEEDATFMWRGKHGLENMTGEIFNPCDKKYGSVEYEDDEYEDKVAGDEILDTVDMDESLRTYLMGAPSGMLTKENEHIFQKTFKKSFREEEDVKAVDLTEDNSSNSNSEVQVVFEDLDPDLVKKGNNKKLQNHRQVSTSRKVKVKQRDSAASFEVYVDEESSENEDEESSENEDEESSENEDEESSENEDEESSENEDEESFENEDEESEKVDGEESTKTDDNDMSEEEKEDVATIFDSEISDEEDECTRNENDKVQDMEIDKSVDECEDEEARTTEDESPRVTKTDEKPNNEAQDENKDSTMLVAVNPPPDAASSSDPDPKSDNEYFENLQRRLWRARDTKERKDPLKMSKLIQLMSTDENEINLMFNHTRFKFREVKRIPFIDNPIVTNGLMPILAPPIPRPVLAASQALSIYVNFSSNPGEFQWKCKSVNEQMANSLDDDLYNRKKKGAQRKWDSSKYQDEFVDPEDTIFHVVFYHQSGIFTPNAKLREPEMAVTVNILGSQTLEDLRSKFYCKNDHIGKSIEGDPLTTDTNLVIPGSCLKAMEENFDKPCGMFVGNTMYTNRSSRETQDYSEVLVNWSEIVVNNRKKPGPFNAGSMEESKMMDLEFKHGFPYLFVHQGNCEHLFVIEKARIIRPEEHLLKDSFPAIIKSNFRTMYCQVDNTRIARYAVRNTKWFPQDPMLLCPECLELCFEDDKRVEDFLLYSFPQISSLF